MRPIVFLAILLLAGFSCSAQLAVLRGVQQNRALAKYYIHEQKPDSACIAFKRYIDNKTYSTPSDWVAYSMSSLQSGDTNTFKTYLSKGIGAGFDTGVILHAYAKGLNGPGLAILHRYLNANFENIFREGYTKYDTTLIQEVKLIMDLDQMVHSVQKFDSNLKYRTFIGNQVDSINYERIVKLFEAGKYPGYHNCGVHASEIVIIMMHTTDSREDRFQYIMKKLKAEVIKGNISPVEITTIADRHYTGTLTNPRSYYGHWQGRVAELYDCKQVDKFRAEIGMDDLKTEYAQDHRVLPECYEKR